MYWKRHVRNWLWLNFLHYYYPEFFWRDWGKPGNTSVRTASLWAKNSTQQSEIYNKFATATLICTTQLYQHKLFYDTQCSHKSGILKFHFQLACNKWECNIWGKRYNRELEELYNEPNITNVIKSSILRWAGHDVQMDENELPKKILWTNPAGQWGYGWPKSRRTDGREEDARKLGCRNWLADAQDRGRWRNLLEEAKANPGL